MAWTETTRLHYRREALRYASDLTNAEWALIAPFLPSAGKVGRPRKTDLRSVVEAILYMASTGCQWPAIPKDFPPYSTVQGYFYAWSHRGLLAHINHMLVSTVRLGATRVLLIGDSSFHGLIHRSKQGLGSDRLGEVNVGARGPAGLDMFPHRIRCHHDDWNVPAG